MFVNGRPKELKKRVESGREAAAGHERPVAAGDVNGQQAAAILDAYLTAK